MKRLAVVVGMLFFFGLSVSAYATNGMNVISYGGAASGMAGASLGISDDPSAMNNNPAGLTQIKDKELGLGISLLMPNLTHKDFANDKDGESAIFPLPMIAYAQRVGKGPLVLGLGVFAQGGMGAEFKDLNTAFGTKDTTYSNVMYAKITPTLAYQVSDMVSLGLALNVGYSALEFKFFPETSLYLPTMGLAFFGMDMKDTSSFSYGAKLGVMIKPSDMVSLGIVYTPQSTLDPEGGDITFNMSSLGLGKVKYDADVEDFNWPQQLGFGVGIRPNKKLLIGADLTWVDWSSAMDVVTIKATSPDSTMAPSSIDIPFKMKWEDQWVFALGGAYQATDNLTVRAGYNYGKNPIPAENLSPLFPAIVEHHLAVGLGYTAGSWSIDGAWEHAFNKKVTYTNTNLPFGPDAVEEHNQNTIHIYATYKF